LTVRISELEGPSDGPFEEGADEVATLTADQLDDVVSQINGICRNSSLEFAIRVGAVIIHHFYNGDTEAWRHRGPKGNSFRRLAAHPELALSAGALYRCVAIFEICNRLRAASRWRRLGATHLRAVIGVPDDQQGSLLNRANDERWSVQTLEAHAQRLRTSRARGGRRAQSPLSKHLSVLDRCLGSCEAALESIESHDPDELERSLQVFQKIKASLEALSGAVLSRRGQLAPKMIRAVAEWQQQRSPEPHFQELASPQRSHEDDANGVSTARARRRAT
jgi:hypothetical protein